jgi:hypothetical protein
VSARRKYSDAFIARVKALYVLGFGYKRIASMVDAPVASIRNVAGRPKPEPDKDFIQRFKNFCKGEP